ncbi:MAG: hypothetical protein QOK23_2014 [Gammaproteobacteria bacterium]|jgi:hypothetical protein|nr:hypothetical protein [Gammaproteobacteria bacterium]MEA3139845.1 hypothetical protein [Gammaproteobacteria bacterium]
MSISEAAMFLVIFAGLVLCVAYFRESYRAMRASKDDRGSGGDSVA